ncbi:MAG: hypothetical protein J3K34DRAFT_162984 [Monoraphidium minutum]|nr:MAG: hypothetical protein J3K34DRAFT_162984 [Monoraphidium minutum]
MQPAIGACKQPHTGISLSAGRSPAAARGPPGQRRALARLRSALCAALRERYAYRLLHRPSPLAPTAGSRAMPGAMRGARGMSGRPRRAALVLLPLLLLAASARAQLPPPEPRGPPQQDAARGAGPGAPLSARVVSGEAAAGMLSSGALGGPAAERAAERAGFKGAAELQAALRRDPSLRLDAVQGTVHYACPAPPDDAPALGVGDGLSGGGAAPRPRVGAHHHGGAAGLQDAPGGAPAALQLAPFGGAASLLPPPPPLEDAFKLHSRPSAKLALVLDFTGHYYEETKCCLWYTNVTTPAYDIDGDNTTFSDEERRRIIATWQAVSEDFSAFDVDVTTEEALAPGKTLGKRACVGGSSNDWYDRGPDLYSGVSNLNSITGASPVFVFAGNLAPGQAPHNASAALPRRMADTISHELGHAFGLKHDGLVGDGEWEDNYFGCHANKLWGPIMGAPFLCAVTQWSRGEYAGANIAEDDTQIIRNQITSKGGDAFIPDDFGDTKAAANDIDSGAVLAPGGAVRRGAVARAGDADFFRFWANAGSLAVRLDLLDAPPTAASAGAAWAVQGSDLNAAVTLHHPDNTTTAWVSDGTGLLTGTWTAELRQPGYYFVSVQGVGMGANASVGFSDYGSMGRYALGLAGSWDPPAVSCPLATYTVQLPAPGRGCGGGAVIPDSALFSANVPVTVTPALPASFPPGYDTLHTRRCSCRRRAAAAAARRWARRRSTLGMTSR